MWTLIEETSTDPPSQLPGGEGGGGDCGTPGGKNPGKHGEDCFCIACIQVNPYTLNPKLLFLVGVGL